MRLKTKTKIAILQGGEMKPKYLLTGSVVLLLGAGLLFILSFMLGSMTKINERLYQTQQQIAALETQVAMITPVPRPTPVGVMKAEKGSTLLGAGMKVLYRWTIAAEGGNVGWRLVDFQLTGSIDAGGPMLMWVGGEETKSANDGIYLTDAKGNRVKFIDKTSMRIYNLASNTIVPGEWRISHSPNSAFAVFVAYNEQMIPENSITPYEFRADLLYGGLPGDALLVQISGLPTSTLSR
ncbi:MAG: hypothetical protein Q8N65_01610 [bacterium]|nr:hypothetical protein [bacterium]